MIWNLISWITLEIYLFPSGHMFHLNGPRQKFPHHFLDSSLNITFIQLSTYHFCFYLAHLHFIFFCFCVSTDFSLAFLHINPISLSQFLRDLSQTLTPVLIHLFCHKVYYFEFSILRLWYLSWSSCMFSFFNYSISFIFAPNFRHCWQTRSFFC